MSWPRALVASSDGFRRCGAGGREGDAERAGRARGGRGEEREVRLAIDLLRREEMSAKTRSLAVSHRRRREAEARSASVGTVLLRCVELQVTLGGSGVGWTFLSLVMKLGLIFRASVGTRGEITKPTCAKLDPPPPLSGLKPVGLRSKPAPLPS